MSTFAATFDQLVTPDLRKLCRVQGARIALDLETFSDAFGAVARHAAKRGSSGLPLDMQAKLHDWIDTMILLAVDEFYPDVLAYREIVDRVTRDIARCEAAWVTT